MSLYKVYTKEKGLIETNNLGHISGLTWHREDGPARISYYANGNIKRELYYINDIKQRLDGPACIEYADNGNIEFTEYWINGISYTKEQYDKEMLKLKLQSL